MIKLIVFLLSTGFVYTQNNDLSLTAQPPKIILGQPGTAPPSLTLTCSPNSAGIVTIFQLAIGRNRSGTETEIARLSSNAPDTVSVLDTTYGSRLKASGSIGNSAGTKKLEIELSPAVCEDVIGYYCKSVQLTTGGSVGQSEVHVTVSVRRLPDLISITTSPNQTDYEIGSEVTVTCSGNVGNEINTQNPGNNWSWEWRNESSSSWSPYPSPENITYSKPTEVDKCTYFASTSLVYTVNEEEDNPDFRCVVQGKYIATTNVKIRPKPTPGAPVYPSCDERGLMAAVSEQKTVANDSAGFCSNGERERPEAVVMEFCEGPETRLWTEGPAVMSMCDTLPLQTPIALFQFGLYVDNNAGLAGVFMGCSDKGFTMAAQICGHPVDLYHLDMNLAGVSEAENPNRYHVVFYNDPITTHRPILVG